MKCEALVAVPSIAYPPIPGVFALVIFWTKKGAFFWRLAWSPGVVHLTVHQEQG